MTMKKLEYKTFALKVDGVTDDPEVAEIKGYASTFGNEDQGGDIVDKGAFKKTIREKEEVLKAESSYAGLNKKISA